MILEIKTFFLAMLPFGELRVSIPVALWFYDLPVLQSYCFSVLGNMAPVIILLRFLGPVSKYLSHRSYFFNRFFIWLFERTRNNHGDKFKRLKEVALIILVAIPLPFTGAWTGSICAFIFGIKFKEAVFLIHPAFHEMEYQAFYK